MMVCEECKKCSNYMVCENGCYGSDRPCEYLVSDTDNQDFPGQSCGEVWFSQDKAGILTFKRLKERSRNSGQSEDASVPFEKMKERRKE